MAKISTCQTGWVLLNLPHPQRNGLATGEWVSAKLYTEYYEIILGGDWSVLLIHNKVTSYSNYVSVFMEFVQEISGQVILLLDVICLHSYLWSLLRIKVKSDATILHHRSVWEMVDTQCLIQELVQ